MIIDSHCHIDFEDFDSDRSNVLNSAKQAGIEHIIVPGITKNTWPRLQEVCSQYNKLHPAYGLHPYFINKHKPEHLDDLKQWASKEKPIAIGECGLDFYLKELNKNIQIEFFEAQLDIAKENKLPVIIHSRKATEQIIQIIKKKNLQDGMIHSYSGSFEQAKQLIDLGFYISFGGAITYNNATRIRKIAQQIPLDSLLVETDSPDQSGASHQGQRNQPDFIIEVINTLSELHNISVNNIADITHKNALTLFQIDSI